MPARWTQSCQSTSLQPGERTINLLFMFSVMFLRRSLVSQWQNEGDPRCQGQGSSTLLHREPGAAPRSRGELRTRKSTVCSTPCSTAKRFGFQIFGLGTWLTGQCRRLLAGRPSCIYTCHPSHIRKRSPAHSRLSRSCLQMSCCSRPPRPSAHVSKTGRED